MSPQEQLDAILGEAIMALVDSGASASFLGTFAASYRDKFARHLGVPVEQPRELKEVIADAVTEAVQQVFANQAPMAGAVKDSRVRVQVLLNGRRTSVTVSRRQLDKIGQVAGSPDESRRVVRELATAAPINVKNRSAWLEQQIEAYLQLRNQPLQPGAQTH